MILSVEIRTLQTITHEGAQRLASAYRE